MGYYICVVFKKIPVRKVLYVLLPLSFICAVLLIFLYSTKQQAFADKTSFAELAKDYQQKEPERLSYTILLLGFGGDDHSGGSLADAQIVANINTKTKKITFIAVPRDSWVNLPVRSDMSDHYKINNAYAIGVINTLAPNKQTSFSGVHGGGNLAKVAMEEVTGLKIDYYMAVSFDRFTRAIDALSGIAVNVPVTFDDNFYPVKGLEDESCGFSPEEITKFHEDYSGFELEKQFTCRYEHLHFDKGLNQMDGVTALKFIRSRHSNEHGGDFARGVREQAVLIAIKDKLLSLNALNNIDEFYEEFRKIIITDITQEAILEVLPKIGNPKDYAVNMLNINTDNYLENSTSSDGQYILVPKAGIDNWSGIQNYIRQNL